MAWRAIDELRPSLEATRDLLFPFDLRRWLVLAVIAFFVSGASGANPDFSTTAWDAPPEDQPVVEPPVPIDEPLPAIDLGWIVLAAALLATIGLVLVLVGAIMEFVFVRVVTDRDVRLRGYASENVYNGVSLFLFRIALALILLAVVTLPALVLILFSPVVLAVVAIVLVPIVLLVGIGLWVVLRFTADFVVPVMLVEDEGILAAWRSFWPALRSDWKQYGGYAVVRLLLGILAAVLAGFGFVAIGLALAIPFAIVAFAAYFLFQTLLGATAVTTVLLVALGVLYLAAVLVAGVTAVQVPIQTYLRYYSLFVLGSVTPAFDMVGPLRPDEDESDAVDAENQGEA